MAQRRPVLPPRAPVQQRRMSTVANQQDFVVQARNINSTLGGRARTRAGRGAAGRRASEVLDLCRSTPGEQNIALKTLVESTKQEATEKLCLQMQLYATIVAVFGIFVAIIEQEVVLTYVFWNGTNGLNVNRGPPCDTKCRQGFEVMSEILRTIVTISTVVLLYLVVRIYRTHPLYVHIHTVIKDKRHLSLFASAKAMSTDAVKSALLYLPERPYMYMELVLYAFHAPPIIENRVEIEFLGVVSEYRPQSLMIFFMFARIFVLLRLVRDREAVKMQKAVPVLSRSGVSLNSVFIVKRMMEQKPVVTVSSFLFILLFGAGYAARIGESGLRYTPGSEEGEEYTNYFWAMMWMMMATATTVGYGDVFPLTHISRGAATIVLALGIGAISVLTATITDAVQFDVVEEKVVSDIYRNRCEAGARSSGARLIVCWIARIKDPGSPMAQHYWQASTEFKVHLRRVKRLKHQEEQVRQSLDGLLIIVEKMALVEARRSQRLEVLDAKFSSIYGSTLVRLAALEKSVETVSLEIEYICKFLNKAKILKRDADIASDRLNELMVEWNDQQEGDSDDDLAVC